MRRLRPARCFRRHHCGRSERYDDDDVDLIINCRVNILLFAPSLPPRRDVVLDFERDATRVVILRATRRYVAVRRGRKNNNNNDDTRA